MPSISTLADGTAVNQDGTPNPDGDWLVKSRGTPAFKAIYKRPKGEGSETITLTGDRTVNAYNSPYLVVESNNNWTLTLTGHANFRVTFKDTSSSGKHVTIPSNQGSIQIQDGGVEEFAKKAGGGYDHL